MKNSLKSLNKQSILTLFALLPGFLVISGCAGISGYLKQREFLGEVKQEVKKALDENRPYRVLCDTLESKYNEFLAGLDEHFE